MSVATEPQPHSIFACWAALNHVKPVNGSCSGKSNSSSSSSSSVMPASTASSGRSSNTPASSSSTMTVSEPPIPTWTTGTFSFPPCSSRTMRLLPSIPQQKPLQSAKPSTSRAIQSLPGFDAFAELVMASERPVPCVTVTPSSSPAKPKLDPKARRVRFETQQAAPSAPKPILYTPSTTSSSPWMEGEDGDGRITFIFGRLKPARVHYSAPPLDSTSSRNPSPPLTPAESRAVALA